LAHIVGTHEASLSSGKRAPQESLRLPLGDKLFSDDGDTVVGVDNAVIVGEVEGDRRWS
jgi:hypothetical protein